MAGDMWGRVHAERARGQRNHLDSDLLPQLPARELADSPSDPAPPLLEKLPWLLRPTNAGSPSVWKTKPLAIRPCAHSQPGLRHFTPHNLVQLLKQHA